MASLGPSCRRRAPGPRYHHCSTWHADLVESYRLARIAQEARAEAWAIGYATELAAFYRDVEAPVTFKAWLQDFRPHPPCDPLPAAELTEDFAA